jgi:Protein of unknown function (DUF3800)
MTLIAYFDEAGDHSLDQIDADFPVFAVSLLVFDTEHYVGSVVPAVYRLKHVTWGHEAIILHSRDIRKAQGPCWFLRHRDQRRAFYERINAVMGSADVQVFAVVVRKMAHRALHALRARNPYDLALRMVCERLLDVLDEAGQRQITVVAEARGKQEDDQLRAAVRRLQQRGTSTCSAARFRSVDFGLTFVPKAMNVVGTQLADLVAYPVARYVLQPEQANPAFDVVEPKLARRGGERVGLAIYPPHAVEREMGGPDLHREPPTDQENAQSRHES